MSYGETMTDQHLPQAPLQTFAAGWYNDPASGALRWWDGKAWGAYAPAPVPAPKPAATSTSQAGRGLGIAALSIGVVVVIVAMPFILATTPIGLFFTLIPGALAIVFGAVSASQARKAGALSGMGTAGIVLGVVALAASSGAFRLFT